MAQPAIPHIAMIRGLSSCGLQLLSLSAAKRRFGRAQFDQIGRLPEQCDTTVTGFEREHA